MEGEYLSPGAGTARANDDGYLGTGRFLVRLEVRRGDYVSSKELPKSFP